MVDKFAVLVHIVHQEALNQAIATTPLSKMQYGKPMPKSVHITNIDRAFKPVALDAIRISKAAITWSDTPILLDPKKTSMPLGSLWMHGTKNTGVLAFWEVYKRLLKERGILNIYDANF